MKIARPAWCCHCCAAALAAGLSVAAVTHAFAQAPASAAASSAADRRAEERAAERAEAEHFLRNRSELLAAAFLAEPHDAVWAQSAAGTLRRALAGKAVSPRIKGASVDCRSRTCRIELANAPAELSESLPRLALRVAGDFPSMSVGQGELPSGQTVTWVYLSR